MKKIFILLITAMVFALAGCPQVTDDGGGSTPTTETIAWTSAIQTGGADGTALTTGIDLVFAKAITGLTAEHIAVTGATKGALTDNGEGKYNLAISDITVANGEDVTIEIAGIANVTINPSTINVLVYKMLNIPPVMTPVIVNGDFETGDAFSQEGWTPTINWDHFATFSILHSGMDKIFAARTASSVSGVTTSSIEQSITIPAGTYKITSKILGSDYSWSAAMGDTVKIEVLNGETVIATGTADISSNSAQDLDTANFTLTETTEVTIKITIDITPVDAATAIDNVTLVAVP